MEGLSDEKGEEEEMIAERANLEFGCLCVCAFVGMTRWTDVFGTLGLDGIVCTSILLGFERGGRGEEAGKQASRQASKQASKQMLTDQLFSNVVDFLGSFVIT